MISLLAVAFGCVSAGAVELEPGASLKELLEPSSRFVAVSGALPIAIELALAPDKPGTYWLAQWSNINDAPTLLRFVVRGDSVNDEVRAISIPLDVDAPTARLVWNSGDEESTLTAAVGANQVPRLTTADQTGVRSAELLIDGRRTESGSWRQDLHSGTHRFSAQVEDVLGNRAEVEFGNLLVDLDAPDVALQSDAPGEDVWVGRPPYDIVATALDAHGPVDVQVSVAGRTRCRGIDQVSCRIRKAEFDVIAEDALGNVATRTFALKVDRSAPTLVTVPPLQGNRVKVRVGEQVFLSAEDINGVVSSCASRAFGRCVELPITFDAKSGGSYRFRVSATDRFGNKSKQKIRIEVSR